MAYINSSGDVYPCCMGNAPRVFYLGNINEDSLIKILDRASKNIYFNSLIQKGMSWYIDILKKHKLLLKTEFVSECHLCSTIFSDSYLLDKMNDIIKENK